MINHLYVIDSGISIYSYDFKQGSEVDEQLLSGFLTAMGSFARETFQEGLQTIYIENEKLNFYLEPETQLLFCAISDKRDNDSLLENLLRKISMAFKTEMGEILDSSLRSQTDNYKGFDSTLEGIAENLAKERSKKTMFLGLSLGLIFLIGSFILTFIVAYPFLEGADETAWGIVIIFYIFIGLSGSSLISGYFAGNQRMGFINGVIFFVIFAVSLIVFVPGTAGIVLLVIPFAIIICGAAGNYGGLIRERRKLYPIANGSMVHRKEL